MKLLAIKPKCLFYLGLALLFFTIYSSFVAYTTLQGVGSVGYAIFNWPDEMANYFFIDKFIDTSAFLHAEPLNSLTANVFHARSINVLGDNLVPVGFLGILIIFGFIGKIITIYGVTLLTPLFAIIGALAFRGIIRQVFSQKIADISTLLLLTLGSYWYYASLVMLPTILFVSLLLVGIYFYLRQGQTVILKWQIFFSLISGLFIGLALITRPVEFIWVGIILLVTFIFYRQKVRWYQICLFLFSLLIPFSLMLAYNQATYGNVLSVGYLRFQHSTNLIEQMPSEFTISKQSTTLAYLQAIFLPFGFHPKLMVLNFYKYFLKFLWPYVILFLGGLILLWRNKRKKRIEKKEKIFVLIGFCISAWLVIYYGNWLLADKLVLAQNTISSSYVRYWLPINIIILPIIAYLIVELNNLKLSKKIITSIQISLIVILILFSANLVYRTPGDGFIAQHQTIARYYEQAKLVQSIVPADAIIIVDRADKLFFPKYRVIVFNGDASIFPRLKNLATNLPLYYFTDSPDTNIQTINQTNLLHLKMTLTQPRKIDDQFRLFKLQRE